VILLTGEQVRWRRASNVAACEAEWPALIHRIDHMDPTRGARAARRQLT